MASIKGKILIVLALLSFSCIAEATYKYDKSLCYKKITKCCYKIEKCGYSIKVKEDYEKCSIHKCEKICKPYCYKIYKPKCKKVCIKKPSYKCKYTYKYVLACKKTHYKAYHGEHDHTYKPVCKKIKKKVKKCSKHYKKVCVKKCKKEYVKICKKKCKKVCKIVPGKKKIIKVVKYPKYCAKIKCSSETIGSVKKPKPYTGTKGKYDKKKSKTGKCKAIKPYY